MKELENLISRLEWTANTPNEIMDQMCLGGRVVHKDDLKEAIGYLKELRDLKKRNQEELDDNPDWRAAHPEQYGVKSKNLS